MCNNIITTDNIISKLCFTDKQKMERSVGMKFQHPLFAANRELKNHPNRKCFPNSSVLLKATSIFQMFKVKSAIQTFNYTAARVGNPRLRYGSHHKETQQEAHTAPGAPLPGCRYRTAQEGPTCRGNSSHSCISVQDLLTPFEIKPNMTQAGRSATTLTIPASLSNSSPLKYDFCHFSSSHRADF